MGRWADGIWSWDVAWRRSLFERECPIAEELLVFLRSVNLSVGIKDQWRWGGSTSGKFTVKEAHKELMEVTKYVENNRYFIGESARLWKSFAPLKAQVTAWSLLWNRLPTSDTLAKTFELSAEEMKYKWCRLASETAEHLFIRCPEVEVIWNKMVDWIGASWAPPWRSHEHFSPFSPLIGGGKARK